MRTRSAGMAAAIFLALGTVLPGSAHADEPYVYSIEGVALGGYDVVAYFTKGAPQLGTPEYAIKWHGAVWHFASAEALLEFEMNPEAYAPQFGGYCAYGVAQGAISPIEPDQFSIRDGKLYLMRSQTVMDLWRADESGWAALAQTQWPDVLDR